ncbi:MAG TPA: ABC transporter ATP-binding protein [Magnetospirillaceae bacterium]|nr:ABC transporter ATP-binding protein [Magnetospirillaceae bacterium]
MIEVSGLCAGYDKVRILHGLSFTVTQGSLTALIGANGAGKSTTLRAISGMIRPMEGMVRLDGTDITGWPSHRIARAGLAHIPEGRRVFGQLSVKDNLTVGAFSRLTGTRTRGDVAADLERMFVLFPRLAQRRNQPSATLSGGEQQMLAIARALMLSPSVLLLDEPSLGLAPKLVAEVFEAIAQLKAQAITMLLVEQFAFAALAIADQALILENGRIVLAGPARTVRDDPAIRSAYLGIDERRETVLERGDDCL